ncbi:MAG: hypothetical protein HQL82_14790 [Magnetococcales bacterium]|nr:hypothetical protein [Magnetococcales bacterium]
MVAETLMFKVEGAAQASQLSGLAGKTFSVGQVTTAGNGMSKWLFLNPIGGAGKGSIAVKIEGSRQISQLTALAGKTITVGKSPAVIGGIGKWLVLTPGQAIAAGGGAALAGGTAAGTAGMVMMELDGIGQVSQISSMAGKTFTVVPPPAMAGTTTGKWVFLKPVGAGVAGQSDLIALKVQHGAGAQISQLVGQNITVAQAPLVTKGTTGWIILNPVGQAGVGAQSAAATATAVAGHQGATAAKTVAATKAAVPALPNAALTLPKASIATKAATAAAGGGATKTAVTSAVTSGTIWKGTGLSLGLGLGLGAWGPVLLAGAATVVGVGVYGYLKQRRAQQEIDSLV